MTLQTRAVLLGTVYLGGFLILAVSLGDTVLREYESHIFLSWFLLFAVGQFFVFRCPHCHRFAMFGPYHTYHPTLGRKCRHCGKDY